MSDGGRLPRAGEPPAGSPGCAVDPEMPGFGVLGMGTAGAAAAFVGFVESSGWGGVG